jgi:hypothetical protein
MVQPTSPMIAYQRRRTQTSPMLLSQKMNDLHLLLHHPRNPRKRQLNVEVHLVVSLLTMATRHLAFWIPQEKSSS